MDAWLPEYIKDPEGTNLLVTRSEEIDRFLRECPASDISLQLLAPERVVQSQKNAVRRKRLKVFGFKHPPKRYASRPQDLLDRLILSLNYRISIITGRTWNRDVELIGRKTYFQRHLIAGLYRLRRSLLLPVRMHRSRKKELLNKDNR
jgi:hypothetical protein